MACIYCGANKNLSDSDIIPDFMTNGKILNPNVCKIEHNSKFSDEFESYVFNKLSFMLNHLDIKSSKAREYPKYDTVFVLDDVEYILKGIRSEADTFKRQIVKNEDETSLYGNPETLKKIVESRGGNVEDIKHIDINNKELVFKNTLHYEVFFEHQMFRLVAKMAYEWYCLRNEVKELHEEFRGIIDYITKESIDASDKRVSMVNNPEIFRILDKYEDDGGHVMITYIDTDGGISVIVDVLSICIYNIKICDSIPEYCHNNMLMQHITIDGSGNRKEECLCKKDYNGLPEVLMETISNSGIKEYKTIAPGFPTIAIGNMPSRIDGAMLNMFNIVSELMPEIQKGLIGEVEPDEAIMGHVIRRHEELLQKNTLHPKALLRFIKEHDTNSGMKLNEKATNSKDIFLYYLLYEIGNRNFYEINTDVLKQITSDIDREGTEVKVDQEKAQELLNSLLQDRGYGIKISAGAEVALKWKTM